MCSRQCPTPGPSFPPNNLCWSQCPPCHLFPSFPALFPPNLWRSPLSSFFPPASGAEFPFQVSPPPQFVAESPSHCHCQPPVRRCILSRLTLPRLPQWRYECFSDVINTHSGGKAGPKIFSRKFLEFPPVLAPPPRCRGRASKPYFSSSNFHRPPSRGAQYFFVPRVMAQSTKL